MRKAETEITFPIKGKNLTNLSNSILKAMDVKILNSTLKELDVYLLQEKYKNIVLLLYDGLGSSILDKFLPKESFLQKNKVCNISSVFPATTVAATTSVLTGLEPSEHGWLGWDMFFKDDNETVSVYMNTIKDTSIPAKHNVKERTEMKYKTIIEKINEESSNDAYIVWPFDEKYPCNTLEEISERICALCDKPNKKFIYSYYNNPDKILHQEGFKSINVRNEITKIDKMTEKLYKILPSKTLIIVIADHGHIECEYKTLSEDNTLFELLERTTALEPRACSIKLKEKVDKDYFKNLFLKNYGNEFKLYSKEEVIEYQLFGEKIKNSIVTDNIGDFIAIAIKNTCLRYNQKGKVFKTYHAGITKDEMEVPLIVLKK